MEENKIICHFCGGAGISISDKAISMVSDLGDGFADIEYNYIDTSDSNYHNLSEKRGEFWQVKTKSHSNSLIDGSGGERGTNLEDIIDNVSDYLDSKKIKKSVTGEYHMVVFSASGGSGGIIGQGIVKILLQKGIPVFCVCVGDSTTSIYTSNTIKVLENFDRMCVAFKKALCIIYDNNSAEHNTQNGLAEQNVNKKIFNTISSVALFLSRNLESIDNKDMVHLFDQTQYTSFETPVGLYGMHIYSGDVVIPKNAVPWGARTLYKNGTDGAGTGLTLQHSKKGYVIDENACSIYNEQFPLHLVTFANYFVNEHKILVKTKEDYDNISKNISQDRLQGGVTNNEEDWFLN